MQLRVRQIAKNVLFNWLGTIVNMAVGFFFAPFILHRLGDIAYGVWVLAVSVIGYLNLLDLGLRSSVLRFVSKGHTQGDHQGASDAISGALWIRLQISALMLLASAGLAYLFPTLFKVQGVLGSQARWAVMIIGITAAINMCVGVFGGVLSGLNRYDLQNYVSLLGSAVRIGGVVYVLETGHGIVAIACCELVAALVSNALLVRLSRRLYPALKVYLKKPHRETLRRLWSYSVYAFLNTIAVQLVYQTDNIVVGAFISASAVTFYAIGNSLIRYAGQVIGAVASTFVPAASTYEAAGDPAALIGLYINGTRAMLALALPILITFLIRGHTFISLWMGPKYARQSGDVLILLSIPLFFAYANRTADAIAFGVEKHRLMAYCAISEGVANLVLSITLVHWFGIYGVAIGTVIPALVSHLGFWPWYIPKLVGITRAEIFTRVWLPMFLSGLPFAIVSLAFEKMMPVHHLITFAWQLMVSLTVFLLTLAVVFRAYIRQKLMPRIQLFLKPA